MCFRNDVHYNGGFSWRAPLRPAGEIKNDEKVLERMACADVGQSPITPDFVMHLGYSAGKVLVAHESASDISKRANAPPC